LIEIIEKYKNPGCAKRMVERIEAADFHLVKVQMPEAAAWAPSGI
jgi:hypothetical protein